MANSDHCVHFPLYVILVNWCSHCVKCLDNCVRAFLYFMIKDSHHEMYSFPTSMTVWSKILDPKLILDWRSSFVCHICTLLSLSVPCICFNIVLRWIDIYKINDAKQPNEGIYTTFMIIVWCWNAAWTQVKYTFQTLNSSKVCMPTFELK